MVTATDVRCLLTAAQVSAELGISARHVRRMPAEVVGQRGKPALFDIEKIKALLAGSDPELHAKLADATARAAAAEAALAALPAALADRLATLYRDGKLRRCYGISKPSDWARLLASFGADMLHGFREALEAHDIDAGLYKPPAKLEWLAKGAADYLPLTNFLAGGLPSYPVRSTEGFEDKADGHAMSAATQTPPMYSGESFYHGARGAQGFNRWT